MYSTVEQHLKAFYRLMNVRVNDAALTRQGEETDEIAYHYLTQGVWAAQRWMIDNGAGGWVKRSEALSWSGSDAADGGRYSALPVDLLRVYGRDDLSALVEADGTRWGRETTSDDVQATGSVYRIRNEQIWLGKVASIPTALYLEYHYLHPEFGAELEDEDIDFPREARPLIVAEAADEAKDEGWWPGDSQDAELIENALRRARARARLISRRTKAPRQFRKPGRVGNRW